ncbi:MAG: hypothetical protein WBQ16_00050, partial [Nitrososphaeraceae archaeon]
IQSGAGSQSAAQANVCGNGIFSNNISCQNIGNQTQSGGGSQSAIQANVCGNGNGASDINCQNVLN